MVRKKKKTASRKTKKKATRKATPKRAASRGKKAKTTRRKKAKTSRKAKTTRKKKAKTTLRKKAKTRRKPNAAFMHPLAPSAHLAKVVGSSRLPRTQVVKKLWTYIKKHKLQDPTNRRQIVADSILRPIFGKAKVSMFEMAKLVNKHLTK